MMDFFGDLELVLPVGEKLGDAGKNNVIFDFFFFVLDFPIFLVFIYLRLTIYFTFRYRTYVTSRCVVSSMMGITATCTSWSYCRGKRRDG